MRGQRLMAVESDFTETVRQELARTPVHDDVATRAELVALVRLIGSLEVRGGAAPEDRLAVVVTTRSGAVARRLFALLSAHHGIRPEVAVSSAAGARGRATYRLRVAGDGGALARDLGLIDGRGHPREPSGPREVVDASASAAEGLWRGALLASTSLSAPGRPVHLEVAVTSEAVATALVASLTVLVEGAQARHDPARGRVVIKSGTTVGELLVRLGATRAFLAFDDRRLRRQLRDDVTRLTNADEANLRRAIDASARQVRAIETLLEGEAWEALDDEAREVALARLANPEASLAELGEVLEVPRTTVHRRLARLVEIAGQDGREGPSASVGS